MCECWLAWKPFEWLFFFSVNCFYLCTYIELEDGSVNHNNYYYFKRISRMIRIIMNLYFFGCPQRRILVLGAVAWCCGWC
jgi:hypothetical protein